MLPLLRDSSRVSDVKGILDGLWSQLLDMDANYAESYLRWCTEKLNVNRNHQEETRIRRRLRFANPSEKPSLQSLLRSVRHSNHPKNITRGDVVWVRFGINVGDELSDLRADNSLGNGHYAIVIAQKGFMFVVVPISSQPQPSDNPDLVMSVDTTALPGNVSVSQVVFGKIRSVHLRRITKISGLADGKHTIKPEELQELDEKLSKFLFAKKPALST